MSKKNKTAATDRECLTNKNNKEGEAEEEGAEEKEWRKEMSSLERQVSLVVQICL